jgi:hypothetical protein
MLPRLAEGASAGWQAEQKSSKSETEKWGAVHWQVKCENLFNVVERAGFSVHLG